MNLFTDKLFQINESFLLFDTPNPLSLFFSKKNAHKNHGHNYKDSKKLVFSVLRIWKVKNSLLWLVSIGIKLVESFCKFVDVAGEPILRRITCAFRSG